jgi:hypothetical protein
MSEQSENSVENGLVENGSVENGSTDDWMASRGPLPTQFLVLVWPNHQYIWY